MSAPLRGSSSGAVIRSPINVEVVLVLRGTTRPLTGRDVARLVRTGSQPMVNAALRRLTEEGVVRAEQAGSAYLHTLNRDHLAAPALELLADIRAELERRLRAEIAEWEIAPTHVSIFGSAARGEGDTRSDIDVFVVRPSGVSESDVRWRAQLERLADRVFAWSGNHVGFAEISADDVRLLARERPPVVEELRRDAITLAGRHRPSSSEQRSAALEARSREGLILYAWRSTNRSCAPVGSAGATFARTSRRPGSTSRRSSPSW